MRNATSFLSRFYWKVLYDPASQLGVALIGVNNPHLAADNVQAHKVCPEIPDHPLIQELADPDDIYSGVTYACSIPDAKQVIADMPELNVMGVLTSRAGSATEVLN
jgi:hypothetical protein